MIYQGSAYIFPIQHRAIRCNAERDAEVMVIGLGNRWELLPEKRLATQPADQNLFAGLLLEFCKDIPKPKDALRTHDVSFAHHLPAVAAKLTAEIARFVHTPDDNKLLVGHGWKICSVDFTTCIPALANRSYAASAASV